MFPFTGFGELLSALSLWVKTNQDKNKSFPDPFDNLCFLLYPHDPSENIAPKYRQIAEENFYYFERMRSFPILVSYLGEDRASVTDSFREFVGAHQQVSFNILQSDADKWNEAPGPDAPRLLRYSEYIEDAFGPKAILSDSTVFAGIENLSVTPGTLGLSYNDDMSSLFRLDFLTVFTGNLFKVPSGLWCGEDLESYRSFKDASIFKYIYIPNEYGYTAGFKFSFSRPLYCQFVILSGARQMFEIDITEHRVSPSAKNSYVSSSFMFDKWASNDDLLFVNVLDSTCYHFLINRIILADRINNE